MGVDFMVRSMRSYKNSEVRSGSGLSLSSQASFNDREDRTRIIEGEERRSSWSQEGVQGRSENPDQSSSDPGRISFLTVPSTQSSRRPSTADVVIEKLQVEKEDGGGLTISGVALGANCHLSLIIFGAFFILAGIVLSYVAYAIPASSESGGEAVPQAAGGGPEGFQPTENHKQMQIIGPFFLIGGLFMIFIGISLYAISRKISRDDLERRLVLSTVQLEQLENDFSSHSQTHLTPIHTTAPAQNQPFPVLSLRRESWWMEPTPVEHPQTPPDGLIKYDPPSPFTPYGIRSVSPLLNNNMPLSQQVLPISQNDQLHNQQSAMHQQYPNFATKRLSSPFICTFYGECEGSSDIATFPQEGLGISSSGTRKADDFEVNRGQFGRKKSNESEGKMDHLPQVFEVGEASASENDSIASSCDSKSDLNDFQPAVAILALHSVPEIQVTGPSPGISRNPSANGQATTSVPLPRHSRHSITRADSSYPNRPGTSVSNKFQPVYEDR